MIDAAQLAEFCEPVVRQITDAAGPVAPHVWLLFEDGHTEVERSGFDEHASLQWPVVLMTGPELDWVVQWFLPDLGIVGPERESALEVAYAEARAASPQRWTEVFERACDVQLNPMLEQILPQIQAIQ